MQEVRTALASGAQTGLQCIRVGSDFETHFEGLSPRPIQTMDPFLALHPELPRQMYPLRTITQGNKVILPQSDIPGAFPPQTHTGPGLLATDLCVSELLVSFLLFFFS